MTKIQTDDPARWRAPELGPSRELSLSGGRRLRYHDAGSGPVLVFVHGLLVNANLWRKLVQQLAPDFRCITLDLPLGSHVLPLPIGAANDPPAVAELIAEALDALDLTNPVLIGNDTGGALCQIVATTGPERLGGLVLTSCDYRDNFPPKLFSFFKPAARSSALMWALLFPMRWRAVRRTPIAFGWLSKRAMDRGAEDSYLLPVMRNVAVRTDVRGFLLGLDTAQTNRAADRLPQFRQPALIAWSAEDRVFPLAHAHRLAADLPNSRMVLIDDAYTFSMEDNPVALAEAIRRFATELTTTKAA